MRHCGRLCTRILQEVQINPFECAFPLRFPVPLTPVFSLQMLMVLEALVPCFLQKLKSNTVTMESASAARDEIAAIAALATSLQALLYSSETLTRSGCRDLQVACFPESSQSCFHHPQANDCTPDVPL